MWVGATASLLLGLAMLTGQSGPASADPADLSGSWNGSGLVVFPSGSQETARCRAQYARASASSYSVSAVCATSAGRVAQTATLQKSGANSFSGSFYNSEYSFTGTIHVTVNGRSQNVSMSGGGASASLRLVR
jgi:hypothetical protein